MRIINSDIITDTVYRLMLKACTAPSDDVNHAIEKALVTETGSYGRNVLKQILDNNRTALEENIPSCQDTGMAVVFIDIGDEVYIDGNITDAVNAGVRKAYKDGYFRKSVLSPLARINTEDNTPAIIHFSEIRGQHINVSVMAKGFGAENMSRIKMLKPSDGKDGIIDFVVSTAKEAKGNPCPPVILGVGIGGTFEKASYLAKRALLTELDTVNTDPELAEIEQQCRDKINSIGIGPAGFPGINYCLKVSALSFPTHIAGLPVAVNYCCHASRHATEEI